MPYISEKRRKVLDNHTAKPATAGELNYVVTMLMYDYLLNNGRSYQTMNDAIGALEGAKLEFYRRLVAPYEETKIQENGDLDSSWLRMKENGS